MEQKETTKQEAQPTRAAAPAPPVHDSNPFTTAITGIKKLFDTNFSSLVALTLFSVLLFGLVVGIVVAMLIGLIAFVFVNAPGSFIKLYTQYPDLAHFATSINLLYVYIGWAVGIVVTALLISLMQAMQLKLVYASVMGQSIEFGELLKQGAKRTLAVFSLNLLIIAIAAASMFCLLAIATVMQPLIFVAIALAPVLFIAGLYAALRVHFANLSIVNEGLGAIDALKRSWALTSRHVGEVLGIICAGATIVILPAALLQAIARLIPTAVGNILQLLVSIATLAITTILLAAVAQRFIQLRAIKEGKMAPGKTDAMNYLAIVFFIIGLMVVSALNPRPTVKRSPYYPDNTPYHDSQDYHDQTQYDDYNDSDYQDSQTPDYHIN